MTTRQPAVPPAHPAMFAALAVPNFRRYVAGQSLSLIGTWVETHRGQNHESHTRSLPALGSYDPSYTER